MEKQPNKKSLKDFQNSKLSAKQQHITQGGRRARPFSESTRENRLGREEEEFKQMRMTNFCCGNDNGVW